MLGLSYRILSYPILLHISRWSIAAISITDCTEFAVYEGGNRDRTTLRFCLPCSSCMFVCRVVLLVNALPGPFVLPMLCDVSLYIFLIFNYYVSFWSELTQSYFLVTNFCTEDVSSLVILLDGVKAVLSLD